MTHFQNYNDTLLDAFKLHTKRKEIVDRKTEIISKILEYYNSQPQSYLFFGFTPAIFSVNADKIYITEVSNSVLNYIQTINPKVELIKNLQGHHFDCTVAFDEYLTFAKTDDELISKIALLCSVTKNIAITTVKDYKNQDFKEREYSQPSMVKNDQEFTAFIEIHDWHNEHRNSYTSFVYKLGNKTAELTSVNDRKALYFKQLAKFSMDAGAQNFLVHKNLMYKGLLKKNYEHVVSIQFDKF